MTRFVNTALAARAALVVILSSIGAIVTLPTAKAASLFVLVGAELA